MIKKESLKNVLPWSFSSVDDNFTEIAQILKKS